MAYAENMLRTNLVILKYPSFLECGLLFYQRSKLVGGKGEPFPEEGKGEPVVYVCSVVNLLDQSESLEKKAYPIDTKEECLFL